jgi:hypothetical protein
MFIESLISEVEDASVEWLSEPEMGELVGSTSAAVDEARPGIRFRSS